MQYLKKVIFQLVLAFPVFIPAQAQIQDDTLIHLKDAVLLAEQRAPVVQSKRYESEAASKNIEVARYNTSMPTIDATYQAGIGTANNLTGIFYPNGILPISGPPATENRYNPATGSAASILLICLFGRRIAAQSKKRSNSRSRVIT